MGYMIGMPCLKLNNVGRKSASCGGFKSVAEEALEERKGRDPDIDRDLTPDNIYTGYRTAAELMEYSQEHVAELSEQQKAAGGRAIRGDAVVMCATIIKPPAAFMATLTREEQIRFLKDSEEKLDELIGGRQNSKASVIHFDEQGAHLHKFWEPMTGDGRLCAKEAMNLKFFNRLNKEMPAFLRSRGWDIDDCNAYDEAKEALKTEQEKYQERKKRGLTSVQYKAQAEAEKNRLCEEIDDLQTQAEELRRKVKEQELTIAENNTWMEDQAELMGAYQNLADYLIGADDAQQVLDDIEDDLNNLPKKQNRLLNFHAKDEDDWRQRTVRRLRSMMGFVREAIAKMRIFEKEQPDQVKERLSEPVQQRASGLNAQIQQAEAKVDRREEINNYFNEFGIFIDGYHHLKFVANRQLAIHHQKEREAAREYQEAQYCLEASFGPLTLGYSLVRKGIAKINLERERKRLKRYEDMRTELRELCRESFETADVMKDRDRRRELTDGMIKELVDQQAAINDYVKAAYGIDFRSAHESRKDLGDRDERS